MAKVCRVTSPLTIIIELAGTRHLSCLGCSCRPSTKYFFPHRTLFQFICPYRPVSWADSRAGRLTVYVSGHRPRTSQGSDACLRRSSSIVYSSLALGGEGGRGWKTEELSHNFPDLLFPTTSLICMLRTLGFPILPIDTGSM